MLPRYISALALVGVAVARDCVPCDKVTCPDVYQCVAGVIMDTCGCCQVCGRSEGELCDPGWDGDQHYGQCGDNLECIQDQETQEHKCVCRWYEYNKVMGLMLSLQRGRSSVWQ